MKANGFEMFALMLCSCLFGVILTAHNLLNLVTDREMILVGTLYVTVIMFVYIQHASEDAVAHHLRGHSDDQVIDLQESHRRRLLLLKNEHNVEKHQLQVSLKNARALFDRLNNDFDWMSTAYQDQMRTSQELEDRIGYLEDKLQELGQSTPTTRQPFSAPPSQIRFDRPPRRQRSTGLPSPLHQVMKPEETGAVTETETEEKA